MTEWMHPKLNRPVRITYVADAANPHMRKWVEHFVSLGCDVRIVSYRAAEYETVKVHVRGVEKHSKMPVIRQLQTLADYAQVKAELNWPDIVHVHFIYRHRFNMLFAGMKRLVVSTWGTDVVQDEHTLEGGKYDYWRSFILNRATVITATSAFLAEKTRRFLSDQSREIRVIPFGVDIDFFRRKTERPTDPKPLVISFIKHLRKKYGPDVLIRALSKVKSGYSNIKLIMAGKGEMEDELKGLAMELGLADIIEFPGWVDIEGVRDILEHSDIFVQPGGNQPESFGVAAVEAQAMEVPVIASKTGGVPEAVKDDESGILIEPENVDILAEAMDRLIGDAGLRRDMSIAGRKWVEEKFDWRQNARMMEDVYHEVLGW